jgi:hypothetical protein
MESEIGKLGSLPHVNSMRETLAYFLDLTGQAAVFSRFRECQAISYGFCAVFARHSICFRSWDYLRPLVDAWSDDRKTIPVMRTPERVPRCSPCGKGVWRLRGLWGK